MRKQSGRSKHLLDLDWSDCARAHFDQCLITLSKLSSLSNNLAHNVTPHGRIIIQRASSLVIMPLRRIKLCRADALSLWRMNNTMSVLSGK